jgi:hypothetical protein
MATCSATLVGLSAATPFVHLKPIFAFGRLQSSLPKALESLFDPPPSSPQDFIEISYSKVSYDTFLD